MVEDVSFERATIHFHATPFRKGKRGKSRGADRIVPLWPQLRDILGDYLVTRPPTQLLFPAWKDGQERSLSDVCGAFQSIERWGGFSEGQITSKALRHTYCSARFQTLDRGEPVGLDTVRREMGHSDESLVRHIYGHLGTIRHRAPVVEYRVAQHLEVLGKRPARVWARSGGSGGPVVTTDDTTAAVPLSPPEERVA